MRTPSLAPPGARGPALERVRPAACLRVGLEAADAVGGRRAIGRYAREISLALARTGAGIDLRLLLFGRRCRRRAAPFLEALERTGGARARALPIPGKLLHFLWNHSRGLPLEALLGPLDIVHALSFLTPPASPRARTVLTMHGIVNFVRPDLLEPRFVRELARRWDFYLRRADWIVSVSETARREFLERFEFPPERVRTIPLGVSAEFRPLDPAEVDRGLEERFAPLSRSRPYLLFAGGLQRVKNVGGLFQAFARLVEGRRIPHRLVLAGEPADAEPEIRGWLARPGLAERVRFAGHLPQGGGDLPLLYAGADLLVQPSFYEGWASPPLEAMASGTPVVASSSSSLPETCGDAALFADPEDPEALAAQIERAVSDPALRSELVRRGFARSALFTWDRAALATADLYREASSLGPRPSPRRVSPRSGPGPRPPGLLRGRTPRP